MEFLKDKTILITGGTGSFGKSFTKFLLENSLAQKIIVFSRDEYKQFHMAQELRQFENRLRFFIGDIRDLNRLERAFQKVDIVIHAAALKQVPAIEYNPQEAIKTNIIGSQNVVEAALNQNIGKILLISTDKAAQPVNLYGATKLCAEKLFINSNFYSTSQKTKFSAVRYGNVIGSRGSVVEKFLNKKVDKVEITHPDMTRFWISLKQSFNLVLFALKNMEGGEIFIPKIPSMKISDLFKIIAPEAIQEIVGIRPGEKLHETLLTEEESKHGYETEKYYVVIPESGLSLSHFFSKYETMGSKLNPSFRFTSNSNTEWLTNEKLQEIIREI
ncbi:MAG: UDP-N-acetylglucosamine 4,6-dehydratase (inverting) [Candidatus Pacebacteria bacterium]|nr:UDP-N-acetylglucosamine 4,6-dehydratase (inverting) [Candidatus Paceibacterota bacterium]